MTTSRRGGAVGLVVVALGVVAVAARSYRPFTDEPSDATGRAPSAVFIDTTFTLALCVLAILTLIAILVIPFLRPAKKPGDRRSMHGLIAYLVFVVICAAIGTRVLRHPFTPGGEQPDEAVFTGEPPRQRPPPATTDTLRSPEVIWPLVIGVGALVLVAVVAAVVISRRRRRPAPAPHSPAELAAALDDAIDDLRREPDARKAVVAAYARMETALGGYGVPRRPAEAPYEYLGRAGKEIRAEGSMAALTDLFEEAKFSEHAIGEEMRERAIGSLAAVRDEVWAAA